MFERFTDRARRVVVLAQEEARMLNQNYIGTEHILLGLIREGEGVAAKALQALGISLEAVRQRAEEIIGQGQQAPSGHIPFTPQAKKVLEPSLREALQFGHNYVGTEHILPRLAAMSRSRAPGSCAMHSSTRRGWSGSSSSPPSSNYHTVSRKILLVPDCVCRLGAGNRGSAAGGGQVPRGHRREPPMVGAGSDFAGSDPWPGEMLTEAATR